MPITVLRCVEIGLFLATMAIKTITAGVAGGRYDTSLSLHLVVVTTVPNMQCSQVRKMQKVSQGLAPLRGTRPVKVKYLPLLFSDLHTRRLSHLNRGLIPSLHVSSD